MHTQPLPPLIPNLPLAFHAEGKGSWYSLKTPENRFIRIGIKEYLVACLLDGYRSADQVVQAAKEMDGEQSIDKIEVLRIVDWLGKAGVLMTNSSRIPSGRASTSWNPVFFRQNLISGPTMEQIGRYCSGLINRWLAPFVLCLWFIAACAALANWQAIWSCTQKLFVPDSLLWWVTAWAFLKTIHEIGHATFAAKYGCRIQSAGLCWMFFSPVPFVDVSGMWLNTNRWQRSLCCLGGLIFELTISSLALLVFLLSDVDSVRYVCCMLFTMGAIGSMVVNGTPFMKFDGYHVLSEWLAWPNLYSDGQAAVNGLIAKIACPWRDSKKAVRPLLLTYGLLCVFYRFTFWLALMMGAFLTFHTLGLLVVGIIIISCVLLPMLKQWNRAIRQSAASGHASMNFTQVFACHFYAIVWCGFLVLSVGTLIVWMPSPWKPMIPGFVEYSHPHLLRNETEGVISEVLVRPGERVKHGQVLAVLSNPLLERDKRLKELEIVSLREQVVLLQSQQSIGESQGVKAKLDAAQEQWEQLHQKTAALILRSPCDGKVVDSTLHDRMGQFLKSGEDLGVITENEQLEVVGFVEQSDIDGFRRSPSSGLRIRLPNGTLASASITEVLPRASEYLESPQLAASFGGPLSVEIENSEDGASRWKLPKPRFKIKAKLSDSRPEGIRAGQTVGLYVPEGSNGFLKSLMRLGENYWQDFQQNSSSP